MNTINLVNLNVDISAIKYIVDNIDSNLWYNWVNPKNQVVTAYSQIICSDIDELEKPIGNIKSQIPDDLQQGKTIILKYEPGSVLTPHVDYIHKSAINIGLSENSHIYFWNGNERSKVYYNHPLLVNLQNTHSVENDSDVFRYVLKIPFRNSFEESQKKCLHLTESVI